MVKFEAGKTYKAFRYDKVVGTVLCTGTPKEGQATFKTYKSRKLYSASAGIVDGCHQSASELYYATDNIKAYAACEA